MHKALFFAVALVAAVAVPVYAYAAPNFAEALDVVGTGTSVSCSTTATNLDDTSVANTVTRWVLVCNASTSNTVRVGGTGVGANGIAVLDGCIRLPVRANKVLQCYASTTQSVTVVEAY